MKHLFLLAAVLAMVLSPVVAWGEVVVLTAIETGDIPEDVRNWLTEVGLNTSDTAGTDSLASYELVADPAATWPGINLVYHNGTVDITGMTYFNFYVKVEAGATVTAAEVWFSTDGWNAFGGGPVSLPAAGAGWTYVSFDMADPSEETGTLDWTDFDAAGVEVEGSGTFLFDHFTVSTTPAEGQLAGAAQAEAELRMVDGTVGVGETITIAAFEAGTDTQIDIEEAEWFEDISCSGTQHDAPDAVTSYVDGQLVVGPLTGDELSVHASAYIMVDDEEVNTIDQCFDLAWPLAPPGISGTPVAGMLGLGLVVAACALGGAMALRKK